MQVRTRVGDGEGCDTEELSAGGTQLDVVTVVVVDTGLGQHGVVLDLALPVREIKDISTREKFL